MTVSARNIVICSDGTGNSYRGTASNVLRLYDAVLKRHPMQIACYDPGVGTHPLPDGRTRLGRSIRHASELAFGSGVIENVTELYLYLVRHYQPGDRLFLFGFSRGAFTVRALAGMLHVCGLLRPEDEHLLPYAAGLYQTSEDRIRKARRAQGFAVHAEPGPGVVDNAALDDEASRFKTQLSRECTIDLLGIWDTVKAYGWIVPRSFPALRHNPSVRVVRHAVALDEHRSVFQVTGWGDRREDTLGVKEVWFAGDHSDIGGGHPGGSALADASFLWMLGEATQAGLRLDAARRADIETIAASAGSAPIAAKHDLRRGGFRVLDYVPKIDLNNRTYLPRWKLGFGRTGNRKPADHVEFAPLRFHHTVKARGERDPAYRVEQLLARSRSKPNLEVRDEPDQPIPSDAWQPAL